MKRLSRHSARPRGLRTASLTAAVLTLGIAAPAARAQTALTSGNLVIERVGDGTAALTSGSTAVFLDQFSPAGTAVNTYALPNASTRPTTGPYNLTASGSASSEGLLTRSANGLAITLLGYNGISSDTAIAGSSTTTITRTVGILNGAGVIDTGRSFKIDTGNNARGAVSLDGQNIYGFGGGGIDYLGTATSGSGTALTTRTTRQGNIFNNTLFVTNGSTSAPYTAGNGIYQAGTAGTLPTATAPTFTRIIDTASAGSSYAFQFNTAMTVAYIADDRATSSGGIQKWTQSNGTWSLAYTFGSGATNVGARGVTVDWSNPNAPVIYGTSAETSANRLFSITDTGSASTVTTLATAATNTAFRGVDQALLPSVWTSNAGGNWASTTTTTYNSTIGAVATPYDNWSTNLVNDTNLAFQKVNAAALSLNNNTALTSVSSINFTGGGTITGAQNTAYTLTGNALTLSGTAATSAVGTFTANSNTYVAVVANNSGATQTVNVPLTLGAANQAFRAVTAPLVIGGTVANGGNTLTIGGVNNTTLNGAISGTGGLTKVEGGVATLAVANNFGGATSVNGGTLLVTNTSGSGTGTGNVTVSNSGSILGGGTTAGTGGISGTVAVNTGARIAPGTTAGTTAILSTGALTLQGGSTHAVDITGAAAAGATTAAGTAYDQINVTGSVTVGGTLALTFTGYTPTSATNDAYFIVNNDGADAVGGTYASVTGLPVGYGIDYNADFATGALTGGNDIAIVAVPEPATVLGGVLLLGAFGWSQRRRLRDWLAPKFAVPTV